MENCQSARHGQIYLSTTIPYVNAPPHVGHALEIVQADAVARLLRLLGERVWTSTGTDDHSLKNVRAAQAAGVPPQALVRQHRARFSALAAALGARFDEDVATSDDPRHTPSVDRLLSACAARGDLYRRDYRGQYCVGCEQFYRPDELDEGRCREHGTPTEPVEENNWFFRLSRHGAELERAITSGRLRIVPDERRREALSFIARGLDDFSVSRSAARAQGFGVPLVGDPGQVVYVWVDALANYLTAGDYGRLGDASAWSRAARRIHLLGKGVLRFHAIYWPALLLSAGLPLPDELRVHGYLTVEGQKISKSLGNGVDPLELIERFGPTAVRYYLLRHVSPFKDADFSRGRLVTAHDGELADQLGNLARRVLTLTARHPHGPSASALGPSERRLEAVARGVHPCLRRAAQDHELGAALEGIWELVRAANLYVDANAPWSLARRSGDAEARARLETVLATSLGALRVLSITLSPFLPELAAHLGSAVGVPPDLPPLEATSVLEHAERVAVVGEPPLLVPRIGARAPAGA